MEHDGRPRTIGPFTRLGVLAVALAGVVSTLSAEVQFNRDVRPILSDNCLTCHGPDAGQRKAGLRLDLREEAIKAAKSGEVAIVPGKPERSQLVTRIEMTDLDEVMPPPKSHKQLTAAQKDVLKRWIAEGANYEAHWAFTPIRRPEVPAVKNSR